MQKLLLKTYRPAKKKLTKEQSLATEVYEYYNRKISFPRILGMIKLKGCIGVREAWQEAVKSDARDKLALFIWKVSEQRIEFRDV